MSVVIRNGGAGRLVVEPGDRVRATGKLVSLPDGDWIDLAQISNLVGRAAAWKSPRSFRLVGVDAGAVPDGSDRSVIGGCLRVVGVWQDDLITVEAQEPVVWPPPQRTREPGFTGAVPAGGWDSSRRSTDVPGLQDLRDNGQIARDAWLWTDNGAVILRVAAIDVDAVEEVLAPHLARRLYVVRSRYTVGQLREVEQMFAAHHRAWGFESWSDQGFDSQCQPCAEAMLTRVAPDLAGWADSLPDDLLTLTPAMEPA